MIQAYGVKKHLEEMVTTAHLDRRFFWVSPQRGPEFKALTVVSVCNHTCA